jgi:hypothetical protein
MTKGKLRNLLLEFQAPVFVGYTASRSGNGAVTADAVPPSVR